MSLLTDALGEPTGRAAAEAIFSGFIHMQRNREKARGCLIVSGALASGEEAETVPPGNSRPIEAVNCSRVPEAVREETVENGDLPKGTDCATLGRYVATVPRWLGGSGGQRNVGEGVAPSRSNGDASVAVLTHRYGSPRTRRIIQMIRTIFPATCRV